MSWELIVQLVLTYGVPFAEKMWTLAVSGKTPTAADWDELKKLSMKTSVSQMQDALARAGIPLDDPRAAVFLSLVK